MSQGLRELQAYDIAAELEKVLVPSLAEWLRGRELGHCMRVSDLELELMVRLCGRLRAEVPTANVVVLRNGHGAGIPRGLERHEHEARRAEESSRRRHPATASHGVRSQRHPSGRRGLVRGGDV